MRAELGGSGYDKGQEHAWAWVGDFCHALVNLDRKPDDANNQRPDADRASDERGSDCN